MTDTTTPDERAATAALDWLQQQTVEARATLARVQQDVAEAEGALGRTHAAQLLEANEQLVLAAVRAQAQADVRERELNDAARSAERDALTALPNRVLPLDRFERAIARARRHGTRVALLFVDLDHFKQVNDTLGHQAGDLVLQRVAERLASTVRGADTVSRHGGDEFLVLLTDVTQPADAALIGDKMLAALSAPTVIGEHVLRLAASIGVSLYPDDGEDAQTLIGRADTAMYNAKRHGVGGVAFHHESFEPRLPRSTEPASLRSPLAHVEQALAETEQLHAHLQTANEQLLLAALAAQDLQAAAELAQRRQTEVLATVAHELRNPLMPIRTAAALMNRKHKDPAMLPRLQSIIERQVVHLARLVDDLLDVSRVSTGKLRLERQPMDLVAAIAAAIDACRPAMDTRLQSFTLHLPVGALDVHGDPVRLTQVLVNLLDNASKYTPKNGRIGLTVTLANAEIRISVTDTGIGITAAALPHVFEPFVQDPHAVGFSGVGLGIGLTVVRELVEAHGGRVVAHSDGAGLGSEFVVTLPLERPQA